MRGFAVRSTAAVSLAPESLIAEAVRRTGEEAESLRFLDGLRVLVDALERQARLTAAGRSSARASLVTALTTQVQVRRMIARSPETGALAVRPVVITGLLRTGTSFLQRLLAAHPDLHAPALWELMAPADPADPARLRAACSSYVEQYHRAAPEFADLHPLDADLPEECHRLTANSFRHPIYGLRYRIPDYVDWLRTTPMDSAYAFHRDQLRCLLFRRPGMPVVLKCPSHLWYLDTLRSTYPQARIVRLHRSPLDCVPSVCRLTAVVRAARSDTVDPIEIGRYWLDQVSDAFTTVRHDDPTVLDVRYPDLVADPLATVGRVCDHIGVPFTAAARRSVRTALADSTRVRRRNRPSPEEFGLHREELADRFADYIATFSL